MGTPKKPGYYWAKSRENVSWYDCIVRIKGDIPYLSYEAWNIPRSELKEGTNPYFFVFGPRIAEVDEEESK